MHLQIYIDTTRAHTNAHTVARKPLAVHGKSVIGLGALRLTLPVEGHRIFSPVLAVQRVTVSMPGSTAPSGNFTLRWSAGGLAHTETSLISSQAPAMITDERSEGVGQGESMQAKLQAM